MATQPPPRNKIQHCPHRTQTESTGNSRLVDSSYRPPLSERKDMFLVDTASTRWRKFSIWKRPMPRTTRTDKRRRVDPPREYSISTASLPIDTTRYDNRSTLLFKRIIKRINKLLTYKQIFCNTTLDCDWDIISATAATVKQDKFNNIKWEPTHTFLARQQTLAIQ